MEMVKIGDAELAVWRHAGPDDDRPTVFLVSGLGGRAVFWDPVVPALTPYFNVVTHDHRGTGASTKSNIDYSVPQMASDVVSLMDALGVGQTLMIGHSTGGAIAQTIALEQPERISAIVLSATWPGPDVYFQTLFEMRLALLQNTGPDAYLTDGILRAYPPDHLSANPDILTATRQQRLAAFPGAEIETSRVRAVMGHDLRHRIAGIDLPTLVIAAADDQITPVMFSHELADRIPDAQSVILPHGGHFVPHVSTQAYNTAVVSFLNSTKKGD